MPTPHVDDAMAYADAILSGEIDACKLVQDACQRFRDDLAAPHAPDARWAFRADLAEPVMRLASLLPNVKGPDGGKPLKLAP